MTLTTRIIMDKVKGIKTYEEEEEAAAAATIKREEPIQINHVEYIYIHRREDEERQHHHYVIIIILCST